MIDRERDLEELFGPSDEAVRASERDDDDLIGIPRKRGRPRKKDSELSRPRREKVDPLIASGSPKPTGRRAAAKLLEGDDGFSLSSADLLLAKDGVSSTWLQRAFGLSRAMVEKKISKCSPIGYGKFGNPLYSIPEAAQYLVEPKMDIEEYLSTLKPEKLPDRMRESYWNSRLKEQRFLREAGQLWYTDQVLAVIVELLTAIREKLQQIPDTVERIAGLDEKQWLMVRNMIDAVQEDVYQEILKFSDADETFNQFGLETTDTSDGENDGE